ncbi:hypothetical protein [Plantibacter sp. YIM 135249]|uniref:hypothetical protein n=1 Tax=Plantibacter sp. YIM 135249 TaxID=3423918 RepID=UPI003D33444A
MSDLGQRLSVIFRSRWSRFWRVVQIPLALAAFGAGGYILALCAIDARLDEIANWVSTFVTSPGAAGVAAVYAALIGTTAIRHQLVHNKHVEQGASWWKSFEWVTERAIPADGRPGLPYSVSLDMLFPLTETATSSVQERACGGFVDHLTMLTGVVEPAYRRHHPGIPVHRHHPERSLTPRRRHPHRHDRDCH